MQRLPVWRGPSFMANSQPTEGVLFSCHRHSQSMSVWASLTDMFVRDRSACECGCSRVVHEGARSGAPCAVCGLHCAGYTRAAATEHRTPSPARARDAVAPAEGPAGTDSEVHNLAQAS